MEASFDLTSQILISDVVYDDLACLLLDNLKCLNFHDIPQNMAERLRMNERIFSD